MGIALPGAGGATRQSMASGAQVIDGSLKFNYGSGNYLVRNVPLGNQRVFTFSAWIKFSGKEDTSDHHYFLLQTITLQADLML